MITLTLDRIAHGGHCVARHDGQVVFVRHGIPGETVEARITGRGKGDRYLFADAVTVIDPSPDRVTPDCPVAGECGGCDFQHITEARQRQLKAQVITEQLARLGGVELPVTVQAVPRAEMGWRTRARFVADRDGRWGLRRHSSHDVVPVESCPIATTAVNDVLMGQAPGAPGDHLLIVDPGEGAQVVRPPAPLVTRRVADRTFEVPADGFWQVHPGAPEALLAAVAQHVKGVPAWWDLYCGAGLFAGVLAEPGQRVAAVEGDRRAAEAARRNLADRPGVHVVRSDIGQWLRRTGSRPTTVVLDPPRSGAGRGVIDGITASTATTVVHVACDPAALGRDVGRYRAAGWKVSGITGFDLFPMTHHVEAVAVLTRPAPSGAHVTT